MLFFLNIQAQAGEYSYLRFTTREGLAGDNVYCITQDNDGFIWIATETGVSRFDGSSFKNYSERDGLPGNDINWLLVDSKNRVWMSPFKKAICYYYRGRIHNKATDEWLRRIPITSEEKSIAEDSAGNLLIHGGNTVAFVTVTGSCRIYAPTYNGKGFFKPEKLSGVVPVNFLDTSLGHYTMEYKWFDRAFGAYTLNDSTQFTLDISWDGKRRLIIFKKEGPPDMVTQPASMISVGTLYTPLILLCTADGGYLYNVQTKRITDTLLSGVRVNVAYMDKDSGIWLGTSGSGLFYFPRNRSISIRQPRNNLPVHACHFYSDKKDIWVGTNNFQLWKLDQERQELNPVREIGLRLYYPEEGNLLKRLEMSPFRTLSEHRKLSGPNLNIGIKSLMNIGDTLIVTHPTRVFRYIFPDKRIDSIAIDERMTSVYYRNGTYYTGSLNGFYILPKGAKSVSLSTLKPLIKGTVQSIAYSIQKELLWVTTSTDGVYCLNINDHRIVRHFNEKNGLSSPVCTSVFTDGRKAYVGTIDGLNVIDPSRNFSVDCYYTLDGLPSNQINCIYAKDDKVWVSTSEGLSCINIKVKHLQPFFKLNLNQVTISGKDIVADTNDITLRPEDNNIRFDYSGVTFASMGKVRYYYRLAGLDDAWQTTDQRYLQYPSLPSGTYTFELFATDRYNTHSNSIRFTFTVGKKWWEYGWIRISGLLLLLGLTGGVLWWRFAKVQKREKEKIELKEKIIELEQLSLRAQMNPHFIFNSLNSFYQYVIDKDLEGASKFMSDFSHLIRLLFETTSQYEISLDKEIEFLSTYLALERTKHSNSFSYDIVVQPDILTEEIVIPSFIIQPFIENGIWHGIQNRKDAGGEISLSVTADTDFLIIGIEDNGVGRAYTDMLSKRTMNIHNSRGIALTEERIALYNKTHHSAVHFEITDKYEKDCPTGTQVIIKFPLKDIT